MGRVMECKVRETTRMADIQNGFMHNRCTI